jgi:hypothetical protein
MISKSVRSSAASSHVPAPEPLIGGTGLDQVQAGFATQISGVSARKVVISL